jgi:hypothetical protein
MKTYAWRDPMAAGIGMADLRARGLTTRGVLFVALDARGEVHLAVPEDVSAGTKVKVGEKLSLEPPWPVEERKYHFDAVHRLPGNAVLWNGDRRLAQPGDGTEMAFVLSEWLKGGGAKDMFLGCTPHQPGTWWSQSSATPAVALHDKGFVDVVTTPSGLLARRQGEANLYYLSHVKLTLLGPLEGWTPVYESTLGKILLLERRVLADRLVLTCQWGLIEVDLSTLPVVKATASVELLSGFGVVGRIDGGAFAVTVGNTSEWGLVDVAPALLVGAKGDTLADLARSLAPKA